MQKLTLTRKTNPSNRAMLYTKTIGRVIMKLHYHKLVKFGALFFTTGFIFLILENVFYNSIDENGAVQDSLFLPLGVLFVLFGFSLIICWAAVRFFTSFIKKQ